MLFLMNEVVLNLEPNDYAPPVPGQRFSRLTLPFVVRLGAELFSEEPLLQHVAPERARRLAALIVTKAPEVNAAIFIAPRKGCPTEQVQWRFVQVGLDVMGLLQKQQQEGRLTTLEADRQVWRRLAA